MATESLNRSRKYGVSVFLAAALLSLAILFASCQAINPLPTFGVGEAPPEEAMIRKLMKWHSGHVNVYREFRTVFTARAVYLSNDIQNMVVDWEARSKLMSPEERTEFEKRYLGDQSQLIKVLVGFYTPKEQLNDLSQENSVWIAYLKNQDGTITRATCLDADEDSTRIYMRFLKWDLSWSKLYLLCFPYSPGLHNPEDGQLTLVISGPSGQGEIRLQVNLPDNQP